MRPRKDSNDLILGGSQLRIMQVIFRLKETAYGAGIYGHLAGTDSEMSLPQIYAALQKLNEKGLVDFRFTTPEAKQGGRRKKVYSLTGKGQKALNASNMHDVRRSSNGGYAIPGLASLA